MAAIAYLLMLMLVPLTGAIGLLITTPLVLVGGLNFPRLFSIISGVSSGIFAGWGCQTIFSFCEAKFSNTPLLVMGFLFLLIGWGRVERASPQSSMVVTNELDELGLGKSKSRGNNITAAVEAGIMVGTPIGLFIWGKWFS